MQNSLAAPAEAKNNSTVHHFTIKMPSAQTVFVSEYFCAMFTVKCVERWKPLLQDKNSSRVCYFLFLFF